MENIDTGQILEVLLGALGYGLLVHARAWMKLNPDSTVTKVIDMVAANYKETGNAKASGAPPTVPADPRK